jgi:hypothetical protein
MHLCRIEQAEREAKLSEREAWIDAKQEEEADDQLDDALDNDAVDVDDDNDDTDKVVKKAESQLKKN